MQFTDQKILLSGGSGLLGNKIREEFFKSGIQSAILSRNPSNNADAFYWDPEKNKIDSNAFNGISTIIHLAGTSLAEGRWTAERKKKIIDSRVHSADLLFRQLKEKKHDVRTFISASAIGCYGNNGDREMNESADYANDFLGETCRQWENAARRFEQLDIRVIILRIGIVLSREGGALPPLALPVKLFAGAPIGSGKQYMSWIHIVDLARIFVHALENTEMKGVYNAVAPNPVRHKTFMKELAHTFHRPLWPFNVPGWIIKQLLGEKAILVLDGQNVSSEKVKASGFEFGFPELSPALKNIYKT